MAEYSQISEYNENRMSLLIANVGPDDIFISTDFTDVSATVPIGICMPMCGTYNFTWQEHGEICWSIWYANCSRSQILTWEWIGLPAIEPCVFTPSRSKFDIVQCKPTKKSMVQPKPKRPPIDVRVLLYNLSLRANCHENSWPSRIAD